MIALQLLSAGVSIPRQLRPIRGLVASPPLAAMPPQIEGSYSITHVQEMPSYIVLHIDGCALLLRLIQVTMSICRRSLV